MHQPKQGLMIEFLPAWKRRAEFRAIADLKIKNTPGEKTAIHLFV
jgi:hypothetical protein